MDRVCVIGAGSSGIAACQVLHARGMAFDCFEQGSQIGGNWRFMNDNGMSAAYRSLHINTSRDLMAYATFPMPSDYPDYPDHFHIAAYFDAYVDHFGFRDQIRFRHEVKRIAPADDGAASGGGASSSGRGASGAWDVTVADPAGNESTTRYGAVLVANGHHWSPRWPEPPYPGEFDGEQLHSHHYKLPDILTDKRVLVLGIGNSACDIAVESSRNAERTFLAMRRGAYILPKYLFGKPTDETNTPGLTRLPLSLQRLFFGAAVRLAAGAVTDYGLPKPDHKLLSAHPTISSDLLPRIGHGDVTVKPNIELLDGDSVRFVDGSVERIDTIIYCTGYQISLPFFDDGLIAAPDNRIPLYRRVVSVEHPGLYFIGLVQPLGAIMPLAEVQAEWVADVLQGKGALPPAGVMRDVIAREDRRMAQRYVASKRHTIQVDFYPYLRTIQRERRRGRVGGPLAALRARRSHELRLGATR